DEQAKANLTAAGYTDMAQQKCLMDALTDYSVWKHTLIDFSFNTFNKIEGGVDPDFTVSVMEACRKAFEDGCILDNQALKVPLYPADQGVYDEMQKLGQPIQLQTEGPEGMDCQWQATIAQGIKLNASAIEVWPETQYQGFDNFTKEQVSKLVSEFNKPVP